MGQSKVIYETCVLCSIITDVAIDTHVNLRAEYVDGCGQVCKECYKNVYN